MIFLTKFLLLVWVKSNLHRLEWNFTFCLFQSLCSSDDVYRPITSPYISTCIACSALLFCPNMTYKPDKKRTCLLQINRVITVWPVSRQNFHRVQCKIDDPFSPGRLVPIPLTTFYVCRHIFAASQVFSFACFKRKTVYSINVCRPIMLVVSYGPLPYSAGSLVYMRTTNVQPNQTINKWVIKIQNSGYSLPTLDCLFESNPTFTDRNETCARWKAWGFELLWLSAKIFCKPHFRVIAVESWYLSMFDPSITYSRTVRFFWRMALNESMVLKNLLPLVSIQSVKVTFCLFQSFCSSDDACRPISSPYISMCVACSALLFGPNV